jgi:hypothetical protein
MSSGVRKPFPATESTKLVMSSDKDGKIKVQTNQVPDGVTVLKGEVMQITNVNGQIYIEIRTNP